MSGRARRMWMVTLGVLAAGLSAVAVAWACTPTADMTVDRASGPPGTQVTLTGTKFDQGIVEIRWATTDSAPIATAQGPDFSLTVTIPDAAPGYYQFGGVGYTRDGQAAGEAYVSFQVTAPAGQQTAPPAAPTQPGHRPAASRPDSRPSAERRPATDHAVTVAPAAHAAPADPAPAAAATPAAEPVAAAAPAAAQPAERPSRTSTTAAAPRRHAAPRAAAQRAPALRDPVAPVRLDRSTPARRTPSRDAWAPSGAARDQGAGLSAQLAVGAGLLGAGLVALFAGFGVAELRRRRAPAGRRRR